MLGIPLAPLVLGLTGLIPFWALSLAIALHGAFGFQEHGLAFALAAYAAIIISFLGGIRWGLAAARDDGGALNYAISVVPSLAGWALLAAPEPWRLAGLGMAALALGPIDARLVKAGLAPLWLGRLRLILSCGAGLALLFAALNMI